jgi:hypothetical protein
MTFVHQRIDVPHPARPAAPVSLFLVVDPAAQVRLAQRAHCAVLCFAALSRAGGAVSLHADDDHWRDSDSRVPTRPDPCIIPITEHHATTAHDARVWGHRSNCMEDAAMAKPAYRAYTVIKRENKDDYWLNLGVAFPHEDGEGFNLLLQAMPLDGKIVLRTYKEDEEEEQKGKGKPSNKK